MRALSSTILLLPVLLCACPKDKQDPPAPPVASVAALASSTPPAPSTSASTARKFDKASDAEIAAHREYRKALAEGRTLTQQKKYGEAIAAFDRALAKEPDNAQGLGERGYARLLAGELPSARADLEAAAKRTQDPKLLSTIHFNFGLVDEKLGDLHTAHQHFSKANELRPSEAAKKKIASTESAKGECKVQQSTQPTKTHSFANWSSAFRALQQQKGIAAPSNDVEARDAITAKCVIDDMINTFPSAADAKSCNTVVDDGKARVIHYEDAEGHDRIAVALEESGKVRVWEDDAWIRFSGRCGPPGYQVLLSRVGTRLVLRVFAVEILPVQLCTKPGGRDANEVELDLCDDTYTESAGSACGDPTWFSRHDAVIDPAKGFLLRLDGWVTTDSKQPFTELDAASVHVQTASIELQSGACKQTLAIP